MSSINFNTNQSNYDSFNDSGIDERPLSPTSAICANLENPDIFNSLMNNPDALIELFKKHKQALISTSTHHLEQEVDSAYQRGLKEGNQEKESLYNHVEELMPQVYQEGISVGLKQGSQQCQEAHKVALQALKADHSQQLAETAIKSQFLGQQICTGTHPALIEAAVDERLSLLKASMSKIESEHADDNQLYYNNGFKAGQSACSTSHASMIETHLNQARLEQEQNRPKYVNNETQTLEEETSDVFFEYVPTENTGLIVEKDQLTAENARIAAEKSALENSLKDTSTMSWMRKLDAIKNIVTGTATVLDKNN